MAMTRVKAAAATAAEAYAAAVADAHAVADTGYTAALRCVDTLTRDGALEGCVRKAGGGRIAGRGGTGGDVGAPGGGQGIGLGGGPGVLG